MAGILAKIAGHILAIPVGIAEIVLPYTLKGEYKKLADDAAEDFSSTFGGRADRAVRNFLAEEARKDAAVLREHERYEQSKKEHVK